MTASNTGFTGYHGFGQCTQEGEYLKNRMTFPKHNGAKRTDKSFRAKSDFEHHLYDSAFVCLSIDLVTQFPLDYLRIMCLGVVKKSLTRW